MLIGAEKYADCRPKKFLSSASIIELIFGAIIDMLEGEYMVRETTNRLTDEEREKVLIEWNDTGSDYPRRQCIHQIFSSQVERQPDAVAVVCGPDSLTYAQLEQRANRLANYLRTLGVGPEVIVGVYLERSLDTVVGLLGILKAGGAYLPLDSVYPADRISYLLQDAVVSVLLTQARMKNCLPEHTARLVVLDDERGAIDRCDPGEPVSNVVSANLANVIYTSGSTGKPKGVNVVHYNVVRLVKSIEYVEVKQSDTFLQLASLAFDASTFEIWAPLLNGAKLVLYSAPVFDINRFASTLRENRVTILWLTSGLFNRIVDTDIATLQHIEQLLIGGEALSVPHVKKFMRKFPASRLINGYGPTEGTTFSTTFPITDPRLIDTTVPIGRPIANARLYVLDDELEPVAIGVPGELYIGGDGVARGYLNRPALTAERFVADPFAAAGARMYRTGDQVRYLSDGNVQFLGRIDQQVKLRGYRIELGEIEAALLAQPGVKQAAVTAQGDSAETRYLVACLAMDMSWQSSDGIEKNHVAKLAAELKTALVNNLPSYMVPTMFIVVDELPLTVNGKIDRRSLPVPKNGGMANAYKEPTTASEIALAGIWEEVLQRASIGALDNFFELGGNSLQSIMVVARIRDAFEIEVPATAPFEFPVLHEFAKYIDSILAHETSVGSSREDPYPTPTARGNGSDVAPMSLSAEQQLQWLLLREERMALDSSQVPLMVRLRGSLDIERLIKSIEEIARRHDILRARIRTVENGVEQQICCDSSFTVSLVDLSSSEKQELDIGNWIAKIIWSPFQLDSELPFRACILRLSEQENILLLVFHHLVGDGWSTGIACREICTLFNAFVSGKESPLPTLPMQYSDYIAWQKSWIDGELAEKNFEFWRERLEGALAPPWPAAGCGDTGAGCESAPLTISSSLLKSLAALGERERATLFMIILTAYKVQLARWSGARDIVVATMSAGRTRTEFEGVIGSFARTLYLRTDLSSETSFKDLLSEIRKTCLDAFRHQDLHPVRLERLATRGSVRISRASFQLLNFDAPVWNLSGIDAEPFYMPPAPDQTGSPKDLHLQLQRESDELRGFLYYTKGLFEKDMMEDFVDGFTALLSEMVSNPLNDIFQPADRLRVQ